MPRVKRLTAIIRNKSRDDVARIAITESEFRQLQKVLEFTVGLDVSWTLQDKFKEVNQ